MDLINYYDSSEKKLRVEIKYDLLPKYHSLFLDSVKNAGLPKGTKVEKLETDHAVILIPIDLTDVINQGPNIVTDDGHQARALEGPIRDALNTLLNNFVSGCLTRESSTTEIIPLSGYPLKNIKLDIATAVKSKRDFCVIDTYDNYKLFSAHKQFSLNQIKLTYLSDEYCDFVVEVHQATSMASLKKKYTPMLVETNWV